MVEKFNQLSTNAKENMFYQMKAVHDENLHLKETNFFRTFRHPTEGKLSIPDTGIKFNNKSIIKKDGIHYIEMKHKNNVQTSLEEIDTVIDLMKQMIGSEFNDNGKKRELNVKDFLIISPYNTQVNLMIAKLEEEKIKNARVGTIDKFQGQEAPVNIISMTSSDSETLPRNNEFFFDKNRLNVAISRAQVASIILFNPKLLEFSPKNINQIKLMNNFFKLLDYKVK